MTTTTLGTEPSAHTIETERWPGVATVPSGLKVRVASPVARALFHKAVARLPLRVQMPNGEFSGGGSPIRRRWSSTVQTTSLLVWGTVV